MTFKKYQHICMYRSWRSFGQYTCLFTYKGCPRSKESKCPIYVSIVVLYISS